MWGWPNHAKASKGVSVISCSISQVAKGYGGGLTTPLGFIYLFILIIFKDTCDAHEGVTSLTCNRVVILKFGGLSARGVIVWK
jgi:hypothetical protein